MKTKIFLGCDLLELEHLAKALARQPEKLPKRLLSAKELALYLQLKEQRRLNYLAKAFCAKEALLKACGTGLTAGLSWQQISVLRARSGAPYFALSADFALNLSKHPAFLAQIQNLLPAINNKDLVSKIISEISWQLSLSDTKNLVMAEVLGYLQI